MRDQFHCVKLLIGTVSIVTTSLANAGEISPPPGPVGPTMKTLDQVEPRIPIHAASLPLTITAPGSYYLAESIVTAGGGIAIDSDNVTIDLRGFTLTGGTGDGISVTPAFPSHRNITIRNGTVSDWGGMGVNATGAENNRIENLCASANNGTGLSLGNGGTIQNCTAQSNGSHGIAGARCTVTNCVSLFNGGSGFALTSDVVLTGCVARDNVGDGIFASENCVIVNCVAISNDGDGIRLMSNNVVSGCEASYNTGDGIDVIHNCRVVANNCSRNGAAGGDGAGIYVRGGDSRLEANNVTNNDRGIDVQASGNIIIKNTAANNTGAGAPSASYDFNGFTQTHGPIVTSTGEITNSNPWANFEY